MNDDIPDPEGFELIDSPAWASCDDCGGTVVVRVWGEGVDSEVWCADCENKDIYR
jgi:hypothetical protein